MRLVEYRPEHFEALKAASPAFGRNSALAHRPFVDHYYTTQDWCRLFLLFGDDERVEGSIGIDRMRFEADGRELFLGFATNFYALQPGAGGLLFMQWMKRAGAGIVFGGSADTHKITRARNWAYAPEVPTYVLNPPYAPRPGEAAWRRAAKTLLRRVARRPLPAFATRLAAGVRDVLAVREEHEYVDGLAPATSAFPFRFAPDLDYLRWRYDLRLPFVRYRLFRILRRGAPAGFVVINDSPSRLIVAHGDADDALALAQGMLLAALEVGAADVAPRTVILTSLNTAMQRVFEGFGFRREGARPLAVGTLKGPIALPADASSYLVNLDWGDNGLRRPFLDEAGLAAEGDLADQR